MELILLVLERRVERDGRMIGRGNALAVVAAVSDDVTVATATAGGDCGRIRFVDGLDTIFIQIILLLLFLMIRR